MMSVISRCLGHRSELVGFEVSPVINITLERAAIDQITCSVIEPETLAQVVEQLGCFHLLPPETLAIDPRVERISHS